MIRFEFGRRIECIEILHVAVQRIADPGEEGSGKPGCGDQPLTSRTLSATPSARHRATRSWERWSSQVMAR